MKCVSIFEEGNIFPVDIMDITNEALLKAFFEGASNVAALSLASHIPTVAGLPHVVADGFKNAVAVSLATKYEFEQAKRFVAAPAAAAAAPTAPVETVPVAAPKAVEPAKPEKPEKPEKPDDKPEDDGGALGGLFDF